MTPIEAQCMPLRKGMRLRVVDGSAAGCVWTLVAYEAQERAQVVPGLWHTFPPRWTMDGTTEPRRCVRVGMLRQALTLGQLEVVP